jgi:hypothetical protein
MHAKEENVQILGWLLTQLPIKCGYTADFNWEISSQIRREKNS